jgi:hypothetical protein
MHTGYNNRWREKDGVVMHTGYNYRTSTSDGNFQLAGRLLPLTTPMVIAQHKGRNCH